MEGIEIMRKLSLQREKIRQSVRENRDEKQAAAQWKWSSERKKTMKIRRKAEMKKIKVRKEIIQITEKSTARNRNEPEGNNLAAKEKSKSIGNRWRPLGEMVRQPRKEPYEADTKISGRRRQSVKTTKWLPTIGKERIEASPTAINETYGRKIIYIEEIENDEINLKCGPYKSKWKWRRAHEKKGKSATAVDGYLKKPLREMFYPLAKPETPTAWRRENDNQRNEEERRNHWNRNQSRESGVDTSSQSKYKPRESENEEYTAGGISESKIIEMKSKAESNREEEKAEGNLKWNRNAIDLENDQSKKKIDNHNENETRQISASYRYLLTLKIRRLSSLKKAAISKWKLHQSEREANIRNIEEESHVKSRENNRRNRNRNYEKSKLRQPSAHR